MSARTLRPGEAVPLTELGPTATGGIAVELRGTGIVPDLIAMLVGEGGKVRSDDDLVFYNNLASLDGGVSWGGQPDGRQWIRVLPGQLDADVHRVILGAAGGLLDQPSPGRLWASVTDQTGVVLAEAEFDAEARPYGDDCAGDL